MRHRWVGCSVRPDRGGEPSRQADTLLVAERGEPQVGDGSLGEGDVYPTRAEAVDAIEPLEPPC